MKYKVGDIVVINNSKRGSHGFTEGDIVKIEQIGSTYFANLIKGKFYRTNNWWITDDNIKRKCIPPISPNIKVL